MQPGPLLPFGYLSSSHLLSLPQTCWSPRWFWKVSSAVMPKGLCPLPGHSFHIISNSPNSFQSFIMTGPMGHPTENCNLLLLHPRVCWLYSISPRRVYYFLKFFMDLCILFIVYLLSPISNRVQTLWKQYIFCLVHCCIYKSWDKYSVNIH